MENNDKLTLEEEVKVKNFGWLNQDNLEQYLLFGEGKKKEPLLTDSE